MKEICDLATLEHSIQNNVRGFEDGQIFKSSGYCYITNIVSPDPAQKATIVFYPGLYIVDRKSSFLGYKGFKLNSRKSEPLGFGLLEESNTNSSIKYSSTFDLKSYGEFNFIIKDNHSTKDGLAKELQEKAYFIKELSYDEKINSLVLSLPYEYLEKFNSDLRWEHLHVMFGKKLKDKSNVLFELRDICEVSNVINPNKKIHMDLDLWFYMYIKEHGINPSSIAMFLENYSGNELYYLLSECDEKGLPSESIKDKLLHKDRNYHFIEDLFQEIKELEGGSI